MRAKGPVQLVIGSNGSGKLRRSFGAKDAPQDDKCDTEKLNRSRNYVVEKMNHEPNIYGADGVTRKGAAVYTPLALAFYDLVVLEFSNSFVWQCAAHVLLDFYNQHISDKHLDIGVGTGYFLDRCRFPSTTPKIALFDLNPHSLAKSAKRLRRYNPSCYMGNALQRIDIGMSGFGSISLNYLFLPIRSAQFPTNWELSGARASAVVRTLITDHVSAERLTASGRGQLDPITENDTPDGRALNRRVEILLPRQATDGPGDTTAKRLVPTPAMEGQP